MLGEVVADEAVEQVGVATQVRVGENDQLAFTGADGERHCAVEVVGVAGEHCRRDQDGGRVRGLGLRADLGGCLRVAADEAVEEGGLIDWHTTTVALDADAALTAD